MNLTKTLFLALVLIAALFYVYKVEIPAGERREKAEHLFPDLKVADLKSISVTNSANSFTLVNAAPNDSTEASWKLEGAEWSGLEASAINSLTSTLLDLKIGKPLASEDLDSDLSVYGIGEGSLTLEVATSNSGEAKTKLVFGKKNDYVSERYLQVIKPESGSDSRKIYLTNDGAYVVSNKSRFDFRDKSPVKLDESKINKIELISAKGNITIERASEEDRKVSTNLKLPKWRITEPFQGWASDKIVNEEFRNLKNLKAEGFIEAEQGGMGASSTSGFSLKVTSVESGKDNQQTFTVEKRTFTPEQGEKNDQMVLSRSDLKTQFILSGDPSSTLVKEADAFRERQLVKFEISKVKEITLSYPEEEQIQVRRQDSDWQISSKEGEQKEGDALFIRQFLTDLSQLNAHGFMEAEEDYGFDNPSLSINLAFESGDLTVQIGKTLPNAPKDAITYYARVNGLPEVFSIDAESLKKISPKLDRLVKVDKKEP